MISTLALNAASALAAPESGAGGSVGEYADRIDKGLVKSPTFVLPKSLTPADLASVRLPDRESGAPSFSLNDDFQLVGARLLDGGLWLDVQQGPRRFTVSTSKWTSAESATAGLSRALGLDGPRQWFAPNLKLRLGQFKFQDLARLLTQTIDARSWDGLVAENKNESLLLKRVMIVEADRVSKWDWNSSSVESKQNLLFTAFAQCANVLSSAPVSFRHCLGNTPFVATPNAFPNRMVDYTTSGGLGLTFRMAYQDPRAVALFGRLEAADLAQFTARLMILSYKDVADIFTASGYPKQLARLYALKLISRRNSLAEAFAANPVQAPDIRTFSALPNIKDGMIVENWADFEADLTKSALDVLFTNLAGSILTKVDGLAREMAATTPFFDVEITDFGKTHIGSGFVLRMHRSVSENPEPTGVDDLYLAEDNLSVGITLGAGMDVNLKVSIWTSLGGGYLRDYSRVKAFPSRQAALKSHWLIPFELIAKQKFDNLERGEAFSIRQGFISVAGAGTTLLAGHSIRPSGYIMGIGEAISTMQVYRAPNDELIIMSGPAQELVLQSKAFWRLYNKWFRISFASFNMAWSHESVKKYRVRYYDESEPVAEHVAVAKSLASGDTYELAGLAPSEDVDISFASRGYRYNLYYLTGRQATIRGDFFPKAKGAADNQAIQRYSLFRSTGESGNRFDRGNLRTHGCAVSGALAFATKTSVEPVDAGLNFKCSLSSDHRKAADWKSDLENLRASFPLSQAQDELLTRIAVKNSAYGAAYASVKIRLGTRGVLPLIAPATDQKGSFDQVRDESGSAMTKWKEPLSGATGAERFQSLLDLISSRANAGAELKRLLQSFPELEITLTSQVEADQSLTSTDSSLMSGETHKGPALLYLINRDKEGERLLSDDI